MPLQAFGLTDVGREREMNEDAHHCDAELGVFVVCDGMGGHAGGEIASALTVKSVTDAVTALGPVLAEVAASRTGTEPMATALRAAIEKASGELYAMGREDKTKRGMGCTCTALAVAGHRAVLAHVGDTRCYLLRGGQLTQISDDHTYLAEAIRHGVLKPEDAAGSPFGNVITRAVGPQPTVIVDVVAFDLAPGDTLLLCSDGMHQYFADDAEIAGILAGPSLEASARTLVQLSNERGGSDNITTLVLRVPEATKQGSRVGTLARVDALRHVDLLRDLTMAEVIRLCQAFEPRDVAAGEFIIREGEQAEDFYVLVDGSVEVYRGPQLITVLPMGSHFGDMALVSQRPRTASVRAVTACHLLTTRRATLYPFLEREPMLAAKFFYKLAQVLSFRLDDLYAQQQILSPGQHAGNGRDTLRFGKYPHLSGPEKR